MSDEDGMVEAADYYKRALDVAVAENERLKRERDDAREKFVGTVQEIQRLDATLEGERAEWHPSEGPERAVSMATRAFRRELRDLDLGRGCAKCSYLEAEHNIDGPEKAPCDGFAAEETGR